jgi:hypothetical protein
MVEARPRHHQRVEMGDGDADRHAGWPRSRASRDGRPRAKDNIDSILRPPLAPPIIDRLHTSFGHLKGVGLDRPGPAKVAR